MLTSQRILRILAVATLVLLAASLVVSADSQGPVDNTLTGSGTSGPHPLNLAMSAETVTAQASPQMLLDDFNRADGPLGPNWTEQASVFRIVSQAARGGTPQNRWAIATYNGGYGNVVEGDVRINGQSLDYTGFVLDYGVGASNLFIKVQDNDGSGKFDRGACYLGNNSSGGTFGLGFFHLSAPFVSAHMKVTVDAARTVTIEFSNIDGGPGTQTYVCTGAPPPEGTGIGIVGYQGTSASMDNFTAQAMAVSRAQVLGWVFLDNNVDGWRQAAETAGLANVKMTLKATDGSFFAQVYSIPTAGWYQFVDVPAGDYCLTAEIPATHVPTTPTEVCFTLAGDDKLINFGVRPGKATISDFVWEDMDGDGVQDAGEPGIPNVTLALWNESGGAPGSVIQTTTTDANGLYSFEVLPGTYFVQVTDELGALAGLTLTSGPQSKPNPFGPITVADGDAYQDADFGYTFPCAAGRAVIGNRVWHDVDGDNVQDAGEPGIAGVTICAEPVSHLATRCAKTDYNGIYRICVRTPPFTYLVSRIRIPGDPVYDLTPTSQDFYLPVVVEPGMHYLDADFGYR